MAEPAPDQGFPDGLFAPGVNHIGRFEWERLIRRCRLGFYNSKTKDPRRWVRHSTVQHVALMLATFADLDGTRVRPSADVLARVCEVDEKTARLCIQRLRGLNLLELVRPACSPGRRGGPGRPAEFRMSAPQDLLERVAYLEPDGPRVIVPDGVDPPPLKKPRKLNGSGGTEPVDDARQGPVDIP